MKNVFFKRAARTRPFVVLLGVLAWLGGGALAHADPVKGAGSARASEWKTGGTGAKVRSRALHRARGAALEAAIAKSTGRPERAAVKAVLANGDAWTGAYRVLRETAEGDEVSIEVEVELDLGRLAKRVSALDARSTDGARYRVDTMNVEDACGESAAGVADELAALGAVGDGDKLPGLSIAVSCRGFGLVPHTLLAAARVSVVATAGEQTLASRTYAGFGSDDPAAFGHAIVQAVGSVAAALREHRQRRVVLRVESPLPAARIRRLQRTLTDSVPGVRAAHLAGVDPDGAVRIAVEAAMDAQGLARAVETLRLDDISITIVRVEGSDALTIRLH